MHTRMNSDSHCVYPSNFISYIHVQGARRGQTHRPTPLSIRKYALNSNTRTTPQACPLCVISYVGVAVVGLSVGKIVGICDGLGEGLQDGLGVGLHQRTRMCVCVRARTSCVCAHIMCVRAMMCAYVCVHACVRARTSPLARSWTESILDPIVPKWKGRKRVAGTLLWALHLERP